MTTCGLSSPCHKGSAGTRGATSSSSAPSTKPLRTSPGSSQLRENWCSASREASNAVTTTARAAASIWSCVQSTPMR
jgi:hypothetical protein